MKKIFIVLSSFIIFTFFHNNSKASVQYNFADRYGYNMTYKTLYLNDLVHQDFYFTGIWGDYTDDTFYFEYLPVEESLSELMFFWYYGRAVPNFMKLYFFGGASIEYLYDMGTEPSGNFGWTLDESWLILIVKKDYFEEYYPGEPILPVMGDITELIRVDTWVVTESTPDYQLGYNVGYQQGYNSGHSTGYNRGYSDGWEAKEAEINALLPGIRKAEYDRGYNDGYDDGVIVGETIAYEKGYQDGANESFIGTMDKWLVPAIIIVMLLGGFFAIARKKREGDI